MRSIWKDVKRDIETELSEKSYSLWINPISFLEQKKDSIVLGCPNKFSLNWVTENYKSILEEKLSKIYDNKYKLVLKVKPKQRQKKVPDLFKKSEQLTIPNIPSVRGNGKKRFFNKNFTFDRFVVGNCNEFAYSASKELALSSSWSYSSLFMLSSTGLGKSHLSHSVGHAILDHDPGVRAYYITAEDFVNEMIFAIKNNKIDEFKNRYRKACDVLLLEEVHFLSGKEKIQLELGYTLDALLNENKKIIFTSSLLPKDIPNMNSELSSRLTSGIITTLKNPDYETRVKIINKKASEQKLLLTEEIIHLFAKNLKRDVRQIESTLNCLRAKSELLNAKIDLDLAQEVIKSHIGEQSQVTIHGIKNLICQYFKVDPAMIESKSRKKIHSYPRNIYIYLCRQHTDATLEQIGETVNRKHSTVLYSSEVVERKIKTDNSVKKHISFLNDKFKDMLQ